MSMNDDEQARFAAKMQGEIDNLTHEVNALKLMNMMKDSTIAQMQIVLNEFCTLEEQGIIGGSPNGNTAPSGEDEGEVCGGRALAQVCQQARQFTLPAKMSLHHPDEVYNLFYQIYHNPDLQQFCNGILVLLDHGVVGTAMQSNPHLQWLRDQATRLSNEYRDDPKHELPGMLYGMIWTAFGKFLADYRSFYEQFTIDLGHAILDLHKEQK